MQFINYVKSTQQLFIVAPALLWRLLLTYICVGVYPETVGVVTIEM